MKKKIYEGFTLIEMKYSKIRYFKTANFQVISIFSG